MATYLTKKDEDEEEDKFGLKSLGFTNNQEDIKQDFDLLEPTNLNDNTSTTDTYGLKALGFIDDPAEIKKGFIDLPSTASQNTKSTNNTLKDSSTKNEEEKNNRWELFNSGALKDGFNLKNLLKTNLATYLDTESDFFSGVTSIVEAPIDIVTNLFATVQDILGFDEAAKKTRQFANTNYTQKIVNLRENITPTGLLYNTLNGWKNKDLTNNADIENDSASGTITDKIANQVGYVVGLAVGGDILDKVGKGIQIGTSTLGAGVTAGNIGVTMAGHTLNLPTLAIFGGMSGALEETNTKENVTELQRWSKAISGGLIEGATEGMFGMFGVGGNEITDELAEKAASHFSRSISKTLVNLGIKAGGEAFEEFMSYDLNFLADNLIINNIGSGDFETKYSLEDVGEQMALAIASTLITAGGGSIIERNDAIEAAEQQLNRKLTPTEKAKITQTVISEAMLENAAIQFNPYEKGRNTEIIYRTDFSPENGEVTGVQATLGKTIDNPVEELDIEPAIVKDTMNNSYNVIDKNTGVLLDTTPYETIVGAETEFNDKITDLDEKAIKMLNAKIKNYKLRIYNKINQSQVQPIQSTLNINNNTAINTTSDNVNSSIPNNNIATQTAINQNTDNFVGGITNVTPNNNVSTQNENIQPENSKFYTGEHEYTLRDINKIASLFDSNTAYTADEIEDIYAYDWDMPDVTTYDEQGNETGSIALQKQGDNIVVEQWDTDGNVIRRNTIEAVNGKITGQAVQNAIKEMALNDNRPVAGQLDIEGNEVGTNIAKSRENKIAKKIEDFIENNSDIKANINISTSEVSNIDIKSIKQMEVYRKARDLFSKISKNSFINNASNIEIFVTNSDIKESINMIYTYTDQRHLLKENLSIYGYLDKIIKNGIEISNETELKGRQKYHDWRYYITPVNIDGQMYIVEFDTVKRSDNETHFRVERLFKLNKGNSATVVPTKKLTTRFSAESPFVTNSVTQNNKSVNSNSSNNTKSMQKSQNNTQNNQTITQESGEDYLPFERIPKKSNKVKIETDNKGRNLSRQQQVFFKDSKIRDTNGNLKTMYHGTMRADRVGNIFNPNKATSGPMAFFTDNEDIATNYSLDKQDTSLSREYETEKDLFKINNMSLDTYWKLLSTDKKNSIREKGYNVGFDEDYNLQFKDNASMDSFGNEYEYLLKNNGNNAINALVDLFINSGYYTSEEMGEFKKVLDYVTRENVTYLDIFKHDSKVYEVYLNIANPFNTSNISEDMIEKLEQASETAKVGKQYSADMWDKSNIEPKQWIEKLHDDIKEGTTHAWTVIPDWVTDILKTNGYDGILDTGGKHGGIGHQVAIPFYSNQIKNVDNTTPTSNDDIRYMRKSKSNINEPKPKTNELAKKGNIKYNSKGIQLGKREYTNLVSAINSDNPNLSNEINYKFYNDSFYVFDKLDFDNYNFIAKIPIGDNEKLIDLIRGVKNNGTIKGTKNVTRIITEFVNRGRWNNSNNDSSERTRKNKQTTRIRSGHDQQRKNDNKERNNNKSIRNQSRVNTNIPMKNVQEHANIPMKNVQNDNFQDNIDRKVIEKELHNRIQNALISKNSRKNTFLGTATQNVVDKVKKLYGIDISGRNHIISDYDIRHIIKQHGNVETEKKKGQIAITVKDIEKIPDIINNYDKIIKGSDNKQGNTIRYIKKYNDNISYVVEVIPDLDNNSLYVKTMWKKPIKNKKEAVALTNSNNAPSSTSKTRGNLTSNTSIPQNASKVNTNIIPVKNVQSDNLQDDIDNFSKQVDNVIKGTFPRNDMLTLLSKTPQPLIDIGLTNLPITMTQKHLHTIMESSGTDTNANYHGLGIDIIKQLPEAINNPLDIIESNTKSDSVVLTTYLADNQDRTIIASIKIDGRGQVNDVEIDTNVMTSAYGKDNYDEFMRKNLENDKILYDIDRGVIKKVDMARFQLPRHTNSEFTGARLQLPRRSSSTTKTNGSSITTNISQNNKSVNSITQKSMNVPYDERKRHNFIEEALINLYNNDEIRKEFYRQEDNINENDGKTNAEGSDRFIEQQIQELEKYDNWDESIPVTSRSDIRKTIEDYLGLNLKKGHFKQRAYGLYKPNRDVIRVKEYKDMDNILHEVGHALDLGKRIQVDKEKISSELLTAVQRHGGYEEASRTEQLDEGFAEVVREYAIVPEQARIDYPQAVTILEGIRKQDDSFDTFIATVQEQIYNYIHQTPRNRELGNQSIGTKRIMPSKDGVKEYLIKNIWDKDYVLKEVNEEFAKAQGKKANEIEASKNVYYMTRLLNGADSKAISMLTDGYIDTNGEYLFPGLNKIGEILGEDPERWNDLRTYLVAQRDLEYKARRLKSGLRIRDSKKVIEQFSNDAEIQEAADLVHATLNGVLQYAVNNGLINQEFADNLRQSNAMYVPMQRDLENSFNSQQGRKRRNKIIVS